MSISSQTSTTRPNRIRRAIGIALATVALAGGTAAAAAGPATAGGCGPYGCGATVYKWPAPAGSGFAWYASTSYPLDCRVYEPGVVYFQHFSAGVTYKFESSNLTIEC